MKKIVFVFSVLAALMMSACLPETRNEQLGIPEDAILLSTENFVSNDTKTAVSGTSVVWVGEGESIDFYVGTGDKQTREVVVDGDNAYIASALEGTGVIRGYYPSGICGSGPTSNTPSIKYPSEYTCSVDGDGRQVIALPMVGKANADAESIRFMHVTAAINVQLMDSLGEDIYVDKVEVISDAYALNAKFGAAVNINGDVPVCSGSPYESGTASDRIVTVTFPTPFEVPAGSSNKSIQVPIRPIGSDYLTIKVYCHSESKTYLYSYKPNVTVPALGRNEMLSAKVKLKLAANGGHVEEIVNSTDLSEIATSSYDASNGEILTGTPSRNLTCNIPDGATVTLKNVSATTSNHYLYIRAKGDATIILSESNVINGTNVIINVVSGKTLTIRGTGSLTAAASSWGCATIGSYSTLPCGNIVIESGTIVANTSSSAAAGIGCGAYGICGTITINGGTVTATGGAGAAGIGTTSASTTHSCGAITINSGTVTVTGGTNSAGIGTGNGNKGTCGDITIKGGTVMATGGAGAAGIGTSANNNANNICGDITIKNTVTSVTATKGANATASIGKGNAGSTCGTVTIETGANVTQN